MGTEAFISLSTVPFGDLAANTHPALRFLFLQRQGRCDTYATEFDLEAEEYVPLPKGDVHKKKEIIQDVTLHDLDVANARPQVLPQCRHDLAHEPFCVFTEALGMNCQSLAAVS